MEKLINTWENIGIKVTDTFLKLPAIVMLLVWPVMVAFVLLYTLITTTFVFIYSLTMRLWLGLSFRELFGAYIKGFMRHV